MLLILSVVARPDAAEVFPIVASFDAGGGLIGRADTARMVLPDPQRTVSRFHAHVSFENGQFKIEDMGSTNPAAINNEPLAAGQRVAVYSGDRLRIGGYTIAVEISDSFSSPGASLPAAEMAAALASEEIFAHTRTSKREPTAAVEAPVVPRGRLRTEDLWRAFQEGAGTPLELPNGLRPETMWMLGSMMKALVAGVRRLMLLRSLAKQELDADTSQLRPRQNNPLKFATDDARALVSLLRPPMPGFLPGAAAVDEALLDLQVHTIATRIAMRVASERVLARFEPEALERRLLSGSFLIRWLPVLRKARLWELYLQQQQVVRAEAAEGFQQAFTLAFADAYQREIERLRQATVAR